MSNNNLVGLPLEHLPKISFGKLQALPVSAVWLALGSNYQANHHLANVRSTLAKLGEIELSCAIKNPDITASKEQPKPDYINQSVYLALHTDMTLGQLQTFCKNLEDECGRVRAQKSQGSGQQVAVTKVSMDIDILMVKLEDQQNSLSSSKDKWIIIAERFPFSDHEMTGIKALKKELEFLTQPNSSF